LPEGGGCLAECARLIGNAIGFIEALESKLWLYPYSSAPGSESVDVAVAGAWCMWPVAVAGAVTGYRCRSAQIPLRAIRFEP